MELQEAWRDVIRPTMIRQLKTPGNKGTEVVMVEAAGGDTPEPEREPITVTTAAAWADLNDYSIGSEVFADVAAYEGGSAETTTYRYRWQTRATAEGDWVSGKWTNYDDHAMEVSTTITELGQIRFQCQARDTAVDPVEQVNSFAAVKTVNTPTKIGNLSCTVNDVPYDLETAPALTVLMNDPCYVVLDHDGDANPSATWDARNEYPALISEQAEHVVMTFPQAGMVTVTCTLVDATATDSPMSALLNFFVVDAKTWADLKSKE